MLAGALLAVLAPRGLLPLARLPLAPQPTTGSAAHIVIAPEPSNIVRRLVATRGRPRIPFEAFEKFASFESVASSGFMSEDVPTFALTVHGLRELVQSTSSSTHIIATGQGESARAAPRFAWSWACAGYIEP